MKRARSKVLDMSEPTPKSALVRMQESRERTDHAYSRARNAAEREVVVWIRELHPAIYEAMAKIVDSEQDVKDRAVRQSRIRNACAAWMREVHRPEWDVLLDRHIAEQTAGTGLKVRRRRNRG